METSKNERRVRKVIRVMSCGRKYAAAPDDAAFVLDCRGFNNPHWEPKLRPKTGASRDVAEYLMAEESMRNLLAALPPLLEAVLPGLLFKSRYHPEVKLVFLCTGGKHRSRFVAISVASMVRKIVARNPEWLCRVVTTHRDQGRE